MTASNIQIVHIISELQDIKRESDSGLKNTQADAQRRIARKRLLRQEFKKIVGEKIYAEWLDADRI